MTLYDAIYTRQSVDRADSISVESQVEFCKKEVVEREFRVYTDKGYSGKNTDRPAFQRLMGDVEAGLIRRVIVYRLDRISRSVLDFANVVDIFQRHHVDFVSTMEKFDTGTPIGKAMLMIVMIFAQLERETIQQRIADAYASRSRRGFFMGGPAPFGFDLKETVIDGVHTKMFVPNPQEASVVRQIFSLYADPQTSLGDVMRYLEQNDLHSRNGKLFSRSRLRDLVICPAYGRFDHRMYEFFRAQGAIISNPPGDFIGVNGAYLYTGRNAGRKTVSLQGQTLVLAPHEGLIDAETWLKCRSKCMNNKSVARPVKAKATWLAGKIKCAYCGYSLIAKVAHRKVKVDKRYLLCNHKYNTGGCTFGSVDADAVEAIVFAEMQKKLADFKVLTKTEQEGCNLQAVQKTTRIEELNAEITSLLEKIASANETVLRYINDRIAALDAEKQALALQLSQLEDTRRENIGEISGYLNRWDTLQIRDKITVVDCLIDQIRVTETSLEIKWKI